MECERLGGIMLGIKLYKNNEMDMERYFDLAVQCNESDLTIEDKGDYYEVVAIPLSNLEEVKQDKLQEVNSWTANKIVCGFTSECTGKPVRFDSDKDTQLTMQGIALNVNSELFAEKYPLGCPVRGYAEGSDTKEIFMLSPAQVMLWQADLSMHIGKCKQEGWAKQDEVNNAKTIEEIEAISFEDK